MILQKMQFKLVLRVKDHTADLALKSALSS